MLNEHDFKQVLKIAINELNNQQFESALTTLKKIEHEQITKNHEVYLGLLSSIYSSLELFDESRDYLFKILSINNQNQLARFQIGLTYFQQQNLEKSKEFWLPLLKNKKDFTTHFYFSFIEESNGNKAKALELITIAKQHCDNTHPIYQQIVSREANLK